MNIIYFLLPISLLLGITFIGLFLWATKKGQFDDLETPAFKILLDEKNIINNKSKGIKK